jgi:GT2 family glycosyltransferase
MQMKLVFVMTNYNNSLITKESVKSIWKISGLNDPYILVVDNSSISEETNILKKFQVSNKDKNLLVFFEKTNHGYFPGLNIGIDHILKTRIEFDAMIIGNNDLFFPEDFLTNYIKYSFRFEQYSVVSPNLITLDGIHQNPHVLKKISNIRKFIYNIYFSNYYLSIGIFKISHLLSIFFKRKDSMNHSKPQEIKIGYGACYILTNIFFKYFHCLDAPVFLMGEECFLSNQLQSNGLKIFYEPEIIVYHQDHASIKSPFSKKIWKITKNSYQLYRKFL